MILQTIRASMSRADAMGLVDLLGAGDPEARRSFATRLDEHGIDAILDDPRTLNALLTASNVRARPDVVFYVLVRQALLEGGIESRSIADYVASVVARFGREGRALRVRDEDDREYRYLVDLVAEMDGAGSPRRFLLELHLGDFALWMSGLFSDYVVARVRRRGAPPLSYYEEMGTTGYRLAAESAPAAELGLERTLTSVAEHFGGIRIALNRVADRYLWPHAGDPVERLLRELARGG